MLQAILIEDEIMVMKSLLNSLSASDIGVTIIAHLKTISESVKYFASERKADLIFSDVQLSDGLSFEIFRQSKRKIPIIFSACDDRFTMSAFQNNGIHYLIKPVNRSELDDALFKFQKLQSHFLNIEPLPQLDYVLKFKNEGRRKRFVVKRGLENIALRLEDVTLFYTEHKVVFVVDRFLNKYISDKTLSEIEAELDRTIFFRANRQYIVNINYIKSFKPISKVKIGLNLNIPDSKHYVTISQETAPAFRKWISEA